jgi:mannose-6-phosphate isomerase-like protein (cupin superfamily)
MRRLENGQPIELADDVIGLDRTSGEAFLMDRVTGGPARIDGYTVGAPLLAGPPPHDGEMHPDGDELLFLISGRCTVELDLLEGRRDVDLGPGQAVVVPRGVWHQIVVHEPGQLVHVTPGPGGDHRPLPET